MIRNLLCALFLTPFTLLAQFTYVLDQNVQVQTLDGSTIKMPWAGGINAAQYNTLDLNSDGKNDLVLFDRMADKVITFINDNNEYKYAPEYETFFPSDLTNWMLLRDFNCDGKNDIFGYDRFGIKVYLNTTLTGENLSWRKFFFYSGSGQPKDSVLLTKGLSDLVNLQLRYDDLPAINDIDGDGDLDILNMKYAGDGSVEYQKNFSKELYGTCDSLAFERTTQAWGNFKICDCGIFVFNSNSCPPPDGGITKKIQGKSLLAIDIDGDTDLDLITSSANCLNSYVLKNTGSKQNSIISNSSGFPSDTPANFYLYPSAYYEDVDFNGVKDIIVTPNIYTKDFLNSNLAVSNWVYKNKGSTSLPNLTFSSTNFLQDKMIDVGDNAVPAFADYDNDGDFDLFISQNASENFVGQVALYKNTGTPQRPEFKLITNDYLSLSQQKLFNLKIYFADLNADGKTDLVFTATSFLQGNPTNLFYIPNKGTGSFDFSGQSPQITDVSIDYPENICIADIDIDGKQDLLIGRTSGALEYWKNTGSLNFILTSEAFLNLRPAISRKNISCAIADLDGDTKADIILTDQSGLLKIVSDFANAKNDSISVSEIVFNPIKERYGKKNLGGRIAPTVVNLYNTDKPAIVVGNILGGLQLLRNDKGMPLPELPGEIPVIYIYPNPVSKTGILNIEVPNDGTLQIFSPLGQKIYAPILLKQYQLFSFNVLNLARGLYLFNFTIKGKSYVKRVVVN